MEEKKDLQRELTEKLKKKRLRKYVLALIALAIVIYAASVFKIEGRDSPLPDGQGQVVDYQQERAKATEQEKREVKAEDKKETKGEKKDQETKASEKDSKKDKDKSAKELKIDNSKDPTASNEGNRAYKPDVAEDVTVTISISCKTLSDDMGKLENKSIEEYIPKDGWILQATTYKGTTENTVFDVLNTVCRNNKVHMEFSFTPVYESNYIEGIGYLYEFDGGPLSGWMYKVNGWFPNYGCSSYYLKDGDVIEWVYTCDLGKDVGDNSMSK